MGSIVVAFTVASVVLWTVLQLTSGRRQGPGEELRDSTLGPLLLADDSITIRRVVEGALEGSGLELVAVVDGRRAIEQLDQRSFGLVIADFHMPGASGLEVCHHAKTQQPARPVILLVGIFEPRPDTPADMLAADHLLEKPFDAQELLTLLAELSHRPR